MRIACWGFVALGVVLMLPGIVGVVDAACWFTTAHQCTALDWHASGNARGTFAFFTGMAGLFSLATGAAFGMLAEPRAAKHSVGVQVRPAYMKTTPDLAEVADFMLRNTKVRRNV